jgi:hypothetical protein
LNLKSTLTEYKKIWFFSFFAPPLKPACRQAGEKAEKPACSL